MDSKDLGPHRRYLREVSEEDVTRRLRYYRLDRSAMGIVPFICISEEIGDKYAKWRDFIHPLDPVSIDDLKNWFGIPNHLARRRLGDLPPVEKGEPVAKGELRAVEKRLLPAKAFVFERLDDRQRAAVSQFSRNLLYTRIDDEDLKDPKVRATIESMIAIAQMRRPQVFVVPDLIVCPNDKVVFNKISVLLFNNVVIYGAGQIRTIGHTKFDAFHLEHVS